MTRQRLDETEFERRKTTVRTLLEERGLDAILIFGLDQREQLHSYLTHSNPRCVVLFTRDGQVIEFSTYKAKSWDDALRAQGESLWPDKLVPRGRLSETIPAEIERQGLDQGRIGTVGVEGYTINDEGWVPYSVWEGILDTVPDVEFVAVDSPFAERILPKSETELDVLKEAARVGDAVCTVMLEKIKPGVSESEVYADAVREIYRNEVNTPKTFPGAPIIFHSAPDGESLAWGEPPWLYRTQRSRILEHGDVVLSEIFPVAAGPLGLETQQQLTVGIAPLNEVSKKGGEIVEQSLEAGLDAAAPGVTFGEVCAAMEEPILEHDDAGWLTPLLHTMSPLYAVGRTGYNIDALPEDHGLPENKYGDLELQEGMILAYEPNVVFGNRRVNIGGTGVVTSDGVRLLEDVPRKLHIV